MVTFVVWQEEANSIMGWARERELVGKNFVWVVTQSVIGELKQYHEIVLSIHSYVLKFSAKQG